MEHLKRKVMAQQSGAPGTVEEMKTKMAHHLRVPYRKGESNGNLKAEEAGRMGGPVGGQMVKELIRMAEETIANRSR
jgi:hypothetical protein